VVEYKLCFGQRVVDQLTKEGAMSRKRFVYFRQGGKKRVADLGQPKAGKGGLGVKYPYYRSKKSVRNEEQLMGHIGKSALEQALGRSL